MLAYKHFNKITHLYGWYSKVGKLHHVMIFTLILHFTTPKFFYIRKVYNALFPSSDHVGMSLNCPSVVRATCATFMIQPVKRSFALSFTVITKNILQIRAN